MRWTWIHATCALFRYPQSQHWIQPSSQVCHITSFPQSITMFFWGSTLILVGWILTSSWLYKRELVCFFVNLLSQFFLHKSTGPFFVFKKGMQLGPFGVPGRKSSVMFSRQSLRRHLFLWDSVDCELLWVMYSGGWWNLGISWIDLLLRFT